MKWRGEATDGRGLQVEAGEVTVRIFGNLRLAREAAGLPCTLTTPVPAEGVSAREIAEFLGLPVDEIEGVFVNHVVYGLGVDVRPGDRIAFVPFGTPGPHRVFLGLYDAGGRKREERVDRDA
jgi:hypothetical protein